MNVDTAWLIPLFPLGAFVIIALFHRILPRQGDVIGVAAILVSFILTMFVVGDAFAHFPNVLPGAAGYEWIRAGRYAVDIGFHVDEITMVMLVVVTFVALMVNVFSTGYMAGEQRYGWFFAVLGLFAFSMLMLVLADNLLLLYASWELVGLCSFLLIGFYWERRSAAEAAKKAFITTRIGDVGMLVGIILLWKATGTFKITEILEAVEAGQISHTYLTVAALALFLGPVGKSAQVPLHVWLPDAMEGPTPVSALIHAATMVVAGVYLVARMLPVFEVAGVTNVILTLGLITAVFAAIVATAQTDIKKVIAYSTLSNLGIMMVALGLGSVAAAMFHLMTHAFFKACLFLGSGSVIHAAHHEQDMLQYGGLRKKMPITATTFIIAALANGGVIPLAGFWSKDEILHAMTSHGNAVVFLIALVWVLLSGIYTARMVYYTFFGAPRNQSLYDHAHESPFPMVLPLVLLGILSVVAGFVVIPDVAKAIGMPEGFAELVRGTRVNPAIVLGEEAETFHFNATLATAGTVSVLLGMYFAWWLVSSPRRVGRFVSSAPDLYNLAKNKFYFDEMYQWLIDRVLLVAAYGVAWFDRNIINDTGVDGTSSLMSYFGYRLKLFQTGRIPNYALAIIAGIITLVVVAFSTIA